MITTLRDLLLQRAARLQGRQALSAPGWGTLSYAQLRNRVEGVALGLLAEPLEPGQVVFAATGGPWDWAAELAAAACGLVWEASGPPVPAAILGGPLFNAEAGRGPYHDRDRLLDEGNPFHAGLSHGELLARLTRLNLRLGWDHDTLVTLPLARIGEPGPRAALWSALYGGSHLVLAGETLPATSLFGRFRSPWPPAWDPVPFDGFWGPG
jgi:hypothetical protein